MSACNVHFEVDKGGSAAGGEGRKGGRRRGCEQTCEISIGQMGGIKGFSTADLVSVLINL